MDDSLEIVRQFLLTEGSELLTVLGGAFVSVDALPVDFQNEHPALVITSEGNTSHVSGADDALTLRVKCYGGSPHGYIARGVALAVRRHMFLPGVKTLSGGSIKQVFYMSDFPGPEDPEEGWPTHIARFLVFTKGVTT